MRQLVGYERYEGKPACDALQRLYEVVRLSINFFQPSMKLVCKERIGAKVKKKYDAAKTPYQRVREAEPVAASVKETLQQEYLTLNPVALLRHIRWQQTVLWRLAVGAAALPAVTGS